MANVPPATVVITSTTGPGQAITAKTISNVTSFTVDFIANTIRVLTNDGLLQYFDYSAVTTFTWVPATATLTIS